MPRLLAAALAALLLVPAAARAQDPKDQPKPAETKDQPKPPPPDVDPKTAEAIRKAVEKAKQEVRDEVHAEMQVAQGSAEFMGTVAPGPKLEFLQLDGYFRTRGQLLDNLDLGRGTDAAGRFLFPLPLQRIGHDVNGNLTGRGGTLATANMRLRIEPTMNVSEHVRLRAQVDVLDNYVLGSNTSTLADSEGSPFPIPFFGSTRAYVQNDPTADRPAIQPKQVWGEVETPLGLLMFGRMPSEWGRGVLANAGCGLDDDYGDIVDRISFTLQPLDTPLGKVSLTPILDFDSEGVLYADPTLGKALGQPIDAESGDDARTYGLKLARIDTEDEIRRKLDAGQSSVNFGAYYNYRAQRWIYPAWQTVGFDGSYTPTGAPDTEPAAKRSGYAHVLDLWARYLKGKWKLELEGVGVTGSIGHVYTYSPDPTATDPNRVKRTDNGYGVDLQQWAGVLAVQYQAAPKVSLGGELGIASGDPAPGFGNQPNATYIAAEGSPPEPPPYGSAEGPQYGQPGDHRITNFRFNPAYNVDLILWRRILGQVTDAWYLRPSLRWDIFPGLVFDGAVIYSQAIYSQSTPSARFVNNTGADRYAIADRGSKPLGVELDGKLTLAPGDGFQAWTEFGMLQPFSGFDNPETPVTLKRAWVLNFGLATKF
jgi:uncharacterized protein (TIGR04551 family)